MADTNTYSVGSTPGVPSLDDLDGGSDHFPSDADSKLPSPVSAALDEDNEGRYDAFLSSYHTLPQKATYVLAMLHRPFLAAQMVGESALVSLCEVKGVSFSSQTAWRRVVLGLVGYVGMNPPADDSECPEPDLTSHRSTN